MITVSPVFVRHHHYTALRGKKYATKYILMKQQGKSGGFDSCNWPSNLTQIGFKSSIFDGWPKKTIGHLFYSMSSFVHHFIHCWIQTGVTVRKRSIQVKISEFFCPLKFDGWPWKTIGHLFYASSSFVHHFIAINEFQLELQSRNAQFGSKSIIFLSHVTLKFDRWPWKTKGHLFYVTSSLLHNFVAIGEFKLELQSGNAKFGSKSTFFSPCDLEIWQMILKNNRAPLLS